MLGNEGRVFAQPVGVAFDGHYDGMVQQSIEQGGCHHGIAKYLRPFAESAVAGHDHGAALVAGTDELEKQVAPT